VTFTDRGTGPCVLVLHGGAGPISVARFAETMSAAHRVLAPTQPGFGGTARPDWFRNIDDVARAYIELLDTLALKDVLVIGFSMGGWIAFALRDHREVRPHATVRTAGAAAGVGARVRRVNRGSLSRSSNIS
jgi:pimeloyl-ACP methyl ester carboxylesterase